MNGTVREVLYGTGVLIVLFLVLTNASQFGEVMRSIGDTYIGGVKTLQGR